MTLDAWRGPAATKWTGMALIAVVGIIHLIEMPEHFEEAAYLGLLFLANGAGAAAAAAGIARDARWGWLLGVAVASGAFMAYVWSRAVGLPGLDADEAEWLEPLGLTSLVAEVLFVALAVTVLTGRGAPAPRRASAA